MGGGKNRKRQETRENKLNTKAPRRRNLRGAGAVCFPYPRGRGRFRVRLGTGFFPYPRGRGRFGDRFFGEKLVRGKQKPPVGRFLLCFINLKF